MDVTRSWHVHCSFQWDLWLSGVGGEIHVNIWEQPGHREKKMKVEAMPRSKKYKKLVTVECAILISCPSPPLSNLLTSSSQVLQLLQWLIHPTPNLSASGFLLACLRPSHFNRTNIKGHKSGLGNKRRMIGRFQQSNFFGSSGAQWVPYCVRLYIKIWESKNEQFTVLICQKHTIWDVEDWEGQKTTMHYDRGYNRGLHRWRGNTGCLNFDKVRVGPWEKIMDASIEEVTL